MNRGSELQRVFRVGHSRHVALAVLEAPACVQDRVYQAPPPRALRVEVQFVTEDIEASVVDGYRHIESSM